MKNLLYYNMLIAIIIVVSLFIIGCENVVDGNAYDVTNSSSIVQDDDISKISYDAINEDKIKQIEHIKALVDLIEQKKHGVEQRKYIIKQAQKKLVEAQEKTKDAIRYAKLKEKEAQLTLQYANEKQLIAQRASQQAKEKQAAAQKSPHDANLQTAARLAQFLLEEETKVAQRAELMLIDRRAQLRDAQQKVVQLQEQEMIVQSLIQKSRQNLLVFQTVSAELIRAKKIALGLM